MENINQTEIKKPSQNSLILAIIATIFGCCSAYYFGFLLGVTAIVLSILSNNKFKAGDYLTAQKYVKMAKAFSIASFLTVVLTFGYGFYDYNKNPEKYQKVYEEVLKGIEEAKQNK